MKRKIKLITCETCGANTEYFAIVDNKKLCAKCEQRTKSKNQRIIELCNQIDQLEQQLEESFTEEDVEGLIEDRNKTIKFLQKELAEKDKEIERLKNLFELNNEVVINQGKEIFDLRVQVLQQKQNQIQLALQELEKVRKEFEIRLIGKKWEDKMLIGKVCNMINDVLDNQIKELKGE